MATLHEQFGHPRGVLGAIVGHVMAVKNARRSAWVLGLLAPANGERILEIGFGSGADVRRLLDAVGPDGRVAGVDVSEVMVRQATRRCSGGVFEGRADLRKGEASALPFGDEGFDAALSVNCAQFWPDLAAGFREIRRVVRPGGRAVVAVQPMARRATVEDSKRWLATLGAAATAAGWREAADSLGPTSPPVAAVLLRREG